MKKQWILTAAIASLSLFGTVPSAEAQDRGRDAAARLDRGEWNRRKIETNDLPREVRETVRREREGDRISQAFELTRGNDKFYRVEFEGRGPDRALILNGRGSVVDERNLEEAGRQQVRMRDLPEEVRKTFRQESNGREIENVTQITRNNRTFYEARIDDRGRDRIIRVGSEGRVLNERDLDEPRLLSDRDDRGRDNRDRDNRDRDDRRANVDDNDWRERDLDVNRLPGEIRAAVGKEMGRDDRITKATELTRGNKTQYAVEISSGERSRELIVNSYGSVIDQNNTTEEGRTKIRFAELPGEVKTAALQELNNREAQNVVQVTRNGRTHFEITPENGRGFAVSDRGDISPLRNNRGRR